MTTTKKISLIGIAVLALVCVAGKFPTITETPIIYTNSLFLVSTNSNSDGARVITYSNLAFLTTNGLGAGGSGDMLAANNLSDVANKAAARTNLALQMGSTILANFVSVGGVNLSTWSGMATSTISAMPRGI